MSGLVAALLLLAGCGEGAPVAPAERETVETWLRTEQNPLPVTPIAIWHATDQPDSMLCGEIEAPPALRPYRSTLRYVYDGSHRKPVATIEKHEMVVGTDLATSALLVENRSIFDNMWADHCLPSAPIGRRIAGWFAGSDEPPPTSSPMTNAYVERLLKERH